MKTQHQLNEEHVQEVFDSLPRDLSLTESSIPSTSDMPQVVVFRRVSYRMYPGKQVVALYYSNALNKYLSIPFGPDGNLNLSEAKESEGKPTRDNRNKELKFSTEKSDAYATSAERGIYESYINKVHTLREKKEYSKTDAALDAASFIPGPIGTAASAASAVRSLSKGDYTGAALDAASMIPGVGYAAKGAKVARGVGKAENVVAKMSKAGKDAEKASIAKKMSQTGKAETAAAKATTKAPKVADAASKVKKASKFKKAIDIAGGMAKAFGGGADNKEPEDRKSGELVRAKPSDFTKSSWEKASSDIDPVTKKRITASYMKENKMSDLRDMITEGHDSMDISINGRSVTLNTSMAKRILEVYDSVNSKNKKIVESMLNEDLETFKKLLNFSIRN